MFDDEFMNDMLLNPDLYGLEETEEASQKSSKEAKYDEDEGEDK